MQGACVLEERGSGTLRRCWSVLALALCTLMLAGAATAHADPPVHLGGNVVAGGDPLADVEVTVGTETTATDAAGRFDLSLPAGTYAWKLEAADGAWHFNGSGLVLDADREVTLPLALTTLTVAVADERDDSPLAGAEVELPLLSTPLTELAPGFSGWGQALGTKATDAAGEAAFTVFVGSAGNGFQVGWIRKSPRYAPQAFAPDTIRPNAREERQLTWMPQVTGTITDADGGPVAGLRVGDHVPDVTGPDGAFTAYVDPARGARALQISRVAPAGTVWTVDVPVDLTRDATRDVRLPAETLVRARVVNASGRPLPAAVAGVTRSGPVTLGDSTVVTASYPRTASYAVGADGVVAIPVFSELAASGGIVAAPNATNPPRNHAQRGPLTTVTLLGDQTRVSLGGWLKPDGAPLAGVTVRLGDQTAVTGPDGWFVLTVLPGTHALSSSSWTTADGSEVSFADPALSVTADQLRTLAWGAAEPHTVQAVDADGDPVEGAEIELPAYEDDSAPGEVPAGVVLSTIPPVLETDADGEAVVQLSQAARPASATGTATPPPSLGVPPAPFPAFTPGGPDLVVVRLVDPGPSIAIDVVPPASAGTWWTVQSVAVTVAATDAHGVASLTCTVDGAVRRFAQTSGPTTRSGTFSIGASGRHAVACAATDALGHAGAEGTQAVDIDRGKPYKPSLAADRPADSANGWFRDTVTVTTTGAGDRLLGDGSAGSGVDPASVPGPQTFATSGSHVAAAAVADVAGNTSATRNLTVKVDADAPASTLTCPAGPVVVGARARASWADADAQSGLAGSRTGSVALDTSAAGTFEVTHTATDRVGHSTTSSCSYTVV